MLSHRIGQFHDLQVWFIAQSIDFSPVYRHTSSSLNKTESRSSCGLRVFDEDHLFRFVEVGNVTLLVHTTSEVTGSSSVSRTTTDQAQLHALVVDDTFSEVDCCWRYQSCKLTNMQEAIHTAVEQGHNVAGQLLIMSQVCVQEIKPLTSWSGLAMETSINRDCKNLQSLVTLKPNWQQRPTYSRRTYRQPRNPVGKISPRV